MDFFMRLEIIQSIQFIIIAFLAYVPTVTISGWFEAWVSKKCGDDTPEQFGFLTLNPFVHFDLMGFAVLLAGRLLGDYLPFLEGIPGWGRFIPVSPSELNKKRGIIQLHARGFAHFLLGLITVVALARFVKTGYMGLDFRAYDATSSLVVSIIQVLKLFYIINFMLAFIFLAIGTMRSIIFYAWKDFYVFLAENFLITMIIGFIAVVFLSEIYKFIIANILTLILYLAIL